MVLGKLVTLSAIHALASCQLPLSGGCEVRALDGRALVAPALSTPVLTDRQAKPAAAREQLEGSPENRDAWIWVGRRLGYLGRDLEAIEVYSEALERWPGDPCSHRATSWCGCALDSLLAHAPLDLPRCAGPGVDLA